jgi:hypothetical protein
MSLNTTIVVEKTNDDDNREREKKGRKRDNGYIDITNGRVR